MTIGRVKWTDEELVKHVLAVHSMTSAEQGSMPTANQFRAAGQEPLVNAINKYGGFDHIARLCDLAPANHDSRFGWGWESWFADEARSMGHFVTERTRVKEPFDVMVNGFEVDVKAATGAVIGGGMQWTWRIAKKAHTCDFYALIAAEEEPIVHIVPASEMPLTCATMRFNGKYARWRHAWHLLTADAWHSQYE